MSSILRRLNATALTVVKGTARNNPLNNPM